MTERPRVALFVETSSEFGRLVLRGIKQYLQAHTSWSIYLQQRDLHTRLPVWLNDWRGNGIISRSTNPQFAELILESGLPIVDLTDRWGDLGLPQIWADHYAIGRMAAEHLIERQFRHFGFAGFQDESWSELRYRGFQDAIQSAGFSTAYFVSPWEMTPGKSWDDEFTSLVNWIKTLPNPVGIMAANDIRGQQILDACCEVDLAVPEQAAVIGCDNDAIRCELCDPPLTSIMPNAERIGYRAAELLDQLMNGIHKDETREVIKPLGILTRKSTDILAIDDADIAEAVRIIREQALSGLRVEDILELVPISRSTLERGVRKYLKRSPQAEIRRVQLSHACDLLVQTDLTLPEIARRCGFVHSEYFSVVFKRQIRITPGQYRTLNTSSTAY
ncbi:XylR family transcriptional regulator [Rubinisphaera italica]|uniref:Xylose operon regulatory protein n=1 Tax=Rubinisphaera italica TaxID=2527969 RepID=A0A5C5XF44_9PLAN|nr:XylR family transcriptional regulator [Rubinisphaera italica]TWT61279.1 Xylose operon regulatory protein [Rubinisphaera italica]